MKIDGRSREPATFLVGYERVGLDKGLGEGSTSLAMSSSSMFEPNSEDEGNEGEEKSMATSVSKRCTTFSSTKFSCSGINEIVEEH